MAVLVGMIVALAACVEPFEANFDLNQRILVVEGTLGDQLKESYVRLREAIPSSGKNSTFLSIKGAKVRIIENDNSEIEFIEGDLGNYFAPEGYKGKIGSSYQLKFELANGKAYESNVQTMLEVAPIKNVFQTTVEDELELNEELVPANFIYLNTEDPADKDNFYLWSWTLYEKMDVCRSCEGGRFYTGPGPAGECRQEDGLTRRNVIYDYFCETPCYQVIRSNKINTQSDQFTNGQTISNVLIAEVPYYKPNGGLIVVKQQSLTREAFVYANLLVDQGQNTGGLADTPPAGLIGNIKSLSQNEAVSGYFLVSSISTSRYWIDRSDQVEKNFAIYGLLDGRFTRPEPSSAGPSNRPPFAPCIPSTTRLINPPEGFKE